MQRKRYLKNREEYSFESSTKRDGKRYSSRESLFVKKIFDLSITYESYILSGEYAKIKERD